MTEPLPISHSHQIALLILRSLMTLSAPFLIVMIAVRLIMTPLFLQFEYTRPDFPADFYGFTTADRLNYAPAAIEYLLNGTDISFLGDLRFSDGMEMYNVRELQHMRDVKTVTQTALTVGLLIGVLWFSALTILWRNHRTAVASVLQSSALLTLGLIAAIVIISIISWDSFFTSFHKAFFADGTWRFEYSDTLIRLFPEQFWFDAALLIGGFSILVSLLLLASIRRLYK